MLIDVGIVNYNTGIYLQQCLKRLENIPEIHCIYVIDNASVDVSLATIGESNLASGKIQVIRNDKNYGFSRAINQFIEVASSEYLLVLNPDCIVFPNTLSIVGAALAADSRAGMAGCLLQNSDGTEQRGGRRFLPDLSSSFRRVIYGKSHAELGFDLVNTPLPDFTVEVEAISGAFMLVRRAAIAEVGPMDEGYFLHCEDLDWCMRFHQAGWKILFVPAAKAVHYQGAGSNLRPVFVLWHKHRGMWRFYRKFYSQDSTRVLPCLVWIGIWLRFVLLIPGAMLGRFRKRSEHQKVVQ